MKSIRRRTATLVAMSMAGLLAAGGIVLFVVLRKAMTTQFDDGLGARAAALQNLTRFDGIKLEMDIAGESMPRYSSRADAEYFITWVREGTQWKVLEQSKSLHDGKWPQPEVRDLVVGVYDMTLPGGNRGRGLVSEFAAFRERDEDTDQRAQGAATPMVRMIVATTRAPLDRTLATIAVASAGVGALLFLASIAAANWAVGRGLMPLIELSGRVRELGPETLSERFEAKEMPTELGPIAEQLNALLGRLDEAFARERRFSAAASHELRTPIAELRMLLEVTADRPRTVEQWEGAAGTALGVLGHAQALCEGLLLLSRAEAGKECGATNGRVDVGDALDSAVGRIAAVRHLKHHDGPSVRVEGGKGIVAQIDAAQFGSIIGNLLDNALRHGEFTGDAAVEVKVGSGRGRISIEISNSVKGLQCDDVGHLFEPFWRKDSARTERSGFGLGLAIARALARAHGGDITAAWREPNTLRLRLELIEADWAGNTGTS